MFTMIVFGSVNARKALIPASLPRPLCFEPPKGACVIFDPVSMEEQIVHMDKLTISEIQLMPTIPESKALATLIAYTALASVHDHSLWGGYELY